MYFDCFGNHMGWIDLPVMDDEGDYLGVTILESGARGQNPAELWESHHGQDIIIVRPIFSDLAARKALMRAAACGYRRYDWLLPWALVRKYGLVRVAGLVVKRLNGQRVATPHVRDNRDVCVEYYQEPWEDERLPLCNPDLLLVPDPSGSVLWDVIFDSRKLSKEGA